jgi:hypothetical protein
MAEALVERGANCLHRRPLAREGAAGRRRALLQLTRTLAIEWAGENITVNAVHRARF